MFKSGDLVQTWFDTGRNNSVILYGRVVSAGPKRVTILWESGLSNRVSQTNQNVTIADDQSEARAKLGV